MCVPATGVGVVLRRSTALSVFLALALSSPVGGDVTFSHDTGTTGLPPPPPNAIFLLPDVGDIFTSGPAICSAPGPNLGNALLFDDVVSLGLLPTDNVDALHVTRADYGPETPFLPTYLFSVDVPAGGLPGTAVAGEAPFNRADVFLTIGGGTNMLCVNQNQIGITMTPTSDIDALTVQPVSTIPLLLAPVYFSLAPGSPTLSVIGASPADILVKVVGIPGPPAVAISAAAIGLLPSDNLDGLILVGGTDFDGNGVFDPFDTVPLVFFSVSNASMGAPGTAVAAQALIDPPPGGDIFISLGGGTNGVALDDAAVGLDDDDNIDGLDLETSSTPGEPPFLSPIPPILPPPGCDVGQIQISVCVTGHKQQMGYCCISISVICPPPVGKVDIPLGTLCVPCDDPAAAMAAILTALLGAVMPPGTPGAGTPIFSGPATPKPTKNPLQRKSNLTVNPALAPCKLNTVKLSFSGCLTKDLALLPMQGGDLTGLVDNKYELVGESTAPSMFTLAMPDLPQVFVPLPPGLPADLAIMQIMDELQAQGYQVQPVPPDNPLGGAMKIVSTPLGETVEGVDAIGAPDSGLESFFELTFVPPIPIGCPADLDGNGVVNGFDLGILLGQWTGMFFYVPCPPFKPTDLNEDCRINGFDLAILLGAWGPCPPV